MTKVHIFTSCSCRSSCCIDMCCSMAGINNVLSSLCCVCYLSLADVKGKDGIRNRETADWADCLGATCFAIMLYNSHPLVIKLLSATVVLEKPAKFNKLQNQLCQLKEDTASVLRYNPEDNPVITDNTSLKSSSEQYTPQCYWNYGKHGIIGDLWSWFKRLT